MEKAGREGFRENLAYKQFRSILENFFKRLAMDWFRKETEIRGDFLVQRDEIRRKAALIAKREKQSNSRRKQLKEKIDEFFELVERGIPEQRSHEILHEMENRLANISGLVPEEAGREILRLETELREAVQDLREMFNLSIPRNLALSKPLQRDVERAIAVASRLDREVFGPLESKIDEDISKIVADAHGLVSRRLRIKEIIVSRGARETRKAKNLVQDARDKTENLGKEVFRKTRESLNVVDQAFKEALMSLEQSNSIDSDDKKGQEFGQLLQEKLTAVVDNEMMTLERIRNEIQEVLGALLEGGSLGEVTAEFEQRSEILAEQLDSYSDLAQLGTAVGIIQHEFNQTVVSLRNGLDQLRSWAQNNPETRDAYNSIRTSFEHLDTYLGMFTPLRKRLYRRTITITGKMIRIYLLQIFGERFKRHRIEYEYLGTIRNT